MILILDLDGTLVDTSAIESLRESRDWRGCVDRVAETHVYQGWEEVLEQCDKVAIVTSTVSYYAERMLEFHQISSDCLVAWHDTKRRKPAPDPVLMALDLLEVLPESVLGVGDLAIDAESYRRAGIVALKAAWNPEAEDSCEWDNVLLHPTEILSMK